MPVDAMDLVRTWPTLWIGLQRLRDKAFNIAQSNARALDILKENAGKSCPVDQMIEWHTGCRGMLLDLVADVDADLGSGKFPGATELLLEASESDLTERETEARDALRSSVIFTISALYQAVDGVQAERCAYTLRTLGSLLAVYGDRAFTNILGESLDKVRANPDDVQFEVWIISRLRDHWDPDLRLSSDEVPSLSELCFGPTIPEVER